MMDEQERDRGRRQETKGGALKRRGLVAGAAVLITGMLAKQAAQPLGAANPPVLLGQDNQPTDNTATSISAPSGYGGGSTAVFFVDATASSNTGGVNGIGTTGGPNSHGIQAFGGQTVGPGGSPVGVGVFGTPHGATLSPRALPTAPAGVYGMANGVNGGIGIIGEANMGSGIGGTGVFGQGLTGVYAVSTLPSGPGGTGVYAQGGGTGVFGTAGSGTTAGIGVAGQGATGVRGVGTTGVFGTTDTFATPTGAPGGTGVQGESSTGVGVYGTTSAAGQFGVLGQSLVDNSFGLTGIANGNNCAAFAGATTNASSFAASFQGHVQVFGGAFDVAGMGNKHGISQHPDGSWRTFYSVESPECWVEDFGEGTLVAGKAEIALDADFAALVHTDHYHVFLTEHDQHNALHVTQRTAMGFTVVADAETLKAKGKTAAQVSGTFSWRVVARPKTEANVERLAKGRLAPKIDFTKLPTPPEKKV